MIRIAAGLVLLVAAAAPQATTHRITASATDSVVAGVFVGRTPCGRIANDFTGFPSANCEKIKWELTLVRDASGAPRRYEYRGTRSTRSGTWSVRTGAAHDARATVYQLHYDNNRVLSLLPVGTDVLLLLDERLRVLPGDASWSYALNRIP